MTCFWVKTFFFLSFFLFCTDMRSMCFEVHHNTLQSQYRSQESLWVEHQICDWKVASSNPGKSSGRIFFSRVNFACWLWFSVHSTLVLLQWHIKDLGHSAKSAGGGLHLNNRTPLTHRSRSGLTMPLSSVVWEPIQKSSHATCQRTFGHSRLISLSHCGLILAYRVELVCANWSPPPPP